MIIGAAVLLGIIAITILGLFFCLGCSFISYEIRRLRKSLEGGDCIWFEKKAKEER